MNLTSLRYFLALASYSSFTKASEKLFVSQPTLSRHIAELEADLGVTLFERGKKNVALTEDGRRCLDSIRDIVQKYDELTTDIRLRKEVGYQGVLTIGLPSTIQFDLIIEPLRAFKEQYPRVQVKLVFDRFIDLYRNLSCNGVDCVYTFTSPDEVPPEKLRFEPMLHSPLMLMVAKDHPLARRSEVTAEELNGETFIFFERSESPIRVDDENDFFVKNNITPKNVITSGSPQDVAVMVALRIGISLFFTHSRLDIPEYTQKLSLDKSLWIPDAHLSLAFHRDNQNPTLPLFYQVMKDYCRQQFEIDVDRTRDQ
jgi:DNA-binding transcriptional LysR family regulator